MRNPINFGDARNVVATLHLNREALEDLCYAYGPTDGFSRECFKVLDEVDVILADEAERRENAPGVCVMLKDREGNAVTGLVIGRLG